MLYKKTTVSTEDMNNIDTYMFLDKKTKYSKHVDSSNYVIGLIMQGFSASAFWTFCAQQFFVGFLFFGGADLCITG